MIKILLAILLVLSGCEGSIHKPAKSEKSISTNSRYSKAMSELKSAGSDLNRFNFLDEAAKTSFELVKIQSILRSEI